MDGPILLVEDDPDDKELLAFGLETEGVRREIVWVRDGVGALEYLRRAAEGRAPAPAVVLTDLRMPRMSGVDLLRAMRQRPEWAAIPVAFLTGSEGGGGDYEAARELGAALYLRKPCGPEDSRRVLRSLRELLERPAPR